MIQSWGLSLTSLLTVNTWSTWQRASLGIYFCCKDCNDALRVWSNLCWRDGSVTGPGAVARSDTFTDADEKNRRRKQSGVWSWTRLMFFVFMANGWKQPDGSRSGCLVCYLATWLQWSPLREPRLCFLHTASSWKSSLVTRVVCRPKITCLCAAQCFAGLPLQRRTWRVLIFNCDAVKRYWQVSQKCVERLNAIPWKSHFGFLWTHLLKDFSLLSQGGTNQNTANSWCFIF